MEQISAKTMSTITHCKEDNVSMVAPKHVLRLAARRSCRNCTIRVAAKQAHFAVNVLRGHAAAYAMHMQLQQGDIEQDACQLKAELHVASCCQNGASKQG
jgi:tRNA U54 and U55 pseudouridine synthase Pus10